MTDLDDLPVFRLRIGVRHPAASGALLARLRGSGGGPALSEARATSGPNPPFWTMGTRCPLLARARYTTYSPSNRERAVGAVATAATSA